MPPIAFPPTCTTPGDQFTFLVRANEVVRLIHNYMGYWYRPTEVPLTISEYNTGIDASLLAGKAGEIVALDSGLKLAFPYKSKLFEAEWTTFLKTIFEPAQRKLSKALENLKADLAYNKTWTIKVTEL